MEKSQYIKAIPIYNDITALDLKLKLLEDMKGQTTTLLSIVFDLKFPFQLRGLDEDFTKKLKSLVRDHLQQQRNELVKQFKEL